MGNCELAAVKVVLQISVETETYDEEISGCIFSADALVDSLLKQRALSVPSAVPQNIVDDSAYFAAWVFRRGRDPVGAEAFWNEANRILEVYVDAEKAQYVGVS